MNPQIPISKEEHKSTNEPLRFKLMRILRGNEFIVRSKTYEVGIFAQQPEKRKERRKKKRERKEEGNCTQVTCMLKQLFIMQIYCI